MTIDTSIVGLLKSFSYAIIVPLFAYTGISSELVSILSVLILTDIITAILRELVLGYEIKSRTLWVGIVAKMLLIIVPFVLILIGKGVNINFAEIAKLSLSTFIVAEGYSIIGNIIQIKQGDGSISEQDAITFILKKAQDTIKQVLEALTGEK